MAKKKKFKKFVLQNLSEGPIIQGFYSFKKLTPEKEIEMRKILKQFNKILERK